MMKKSIAVAAASLALGAPPALAQTKWDMPTPYPDANFHTQNIMMFAEDVKKATSGGLEIKVHSNGSLFKHPEIKNAVRGGQVPVGEFLLSRLSNENAVFEVDSVPFLATRPPRSCSTNRVSWSSFRCRGRRRGCMRSRRSTRSMT